MRHYTATWSSALSQIAGKVRSTDPNYYETSFEYDAELNLIKTTYPRGNVTEFRYDIGNGSQRARGNLLRVLSHPGSLETGTLPGNQEHGLLATFTYSNGLNLLESSVSPRGYVVGGSYDIEGHSGLTTDNSSAFTTTYTYYTGDLGQPNPAGTLEKVTSPAVDKDNGAPDTLNHGQKLETTYTYNQYGQLQTVLEPVTEQAAVETTYVYGTTGFSEGYLTQVQFGTHTMTPLVTQYAYNSVGQVISVTDPKGLTYTSYVNQLDQVVRSETPPVTYHGNAVYYSETKYDLNGNVEEAGVSNFASDGTLQSPSLIKTTYQYNILDMATSVTEDVAVSVTRTTQVLYDKIFRAYETILPEGNRSGTDFDEMNRTYKTYFGYDGTTVSRGSALIQSQVDYDENSNVERVVDGRSNEGTSEYDAYGRIVKTTDRLPTNPNYAKFEYNAAGQVTRAERWGRKRAAGWPFTHNWSWENDKLISRTETRYDNIGRDYFTRTMAKNAAGTSDLGYSTDYESPPFGTADGWSTSRVLFRANGQVEEVEDDLQRRTRHEYDEYNRLEAVIDDRDGGGPSRQDDDNFDFYDYDANGNVVAVIAHMYDDVGGSPRVLQETFTYDSLNRLVKDESPPINGSSLVREYRYDSRSNRVWTKDRSATERVYTYDLLGRLVRSKVPTSSELNIDATSGYVNSFGRDVVNRTVYDKNSNAIQSIDSNGNRTYLRFDLANRWIQTQYPDGGTGTPHKRSAGDGHSITAVSGTPFFSKSGAYDGNSNLLKSTDANGTVLTYTYDENDNLLQEAADTSGSSAFGIVGETGAAFGYDGAYRVSRGTTFDGSGDLTEVDNLYNSLGLQEVERQVAHNAHPAQLQAHETNTVVQNSYDELGRRFKRANPFDVSVTHWKFDRKNRPIESWLQRWESSTSQLSGKVMISEYEYIGGGLLHSRQTRYHPDREEHPVISTYTRDDLMRVTSVRHVRDDTLGTLGAYGPRLLSRFDTAYDANSMMRYEARWYEEDDDGASTTPDSTDFFYFDNRNILTKAIYDVTKDDTGTGAELDLSNINWSNVASNNLTHSDRVIFSRRAAGKRNRVNWYRGTADKDDTIPGSFNEGNTAPDQKTHYETTDDPSADPDNPAADGAGSRHNYTEIGQVGYTYDNNRNMLADGTREFRYNYKNQLRKVWRKSDGETVGKVAEYGEDAFGRRVLERSWWELGRHVRFDTRFELDVNLDANSSSTLMELIDGGITTTSSSEQVAEWNSRITKDADYTLGGASYFDFLVEVPAADDAADYLGMVGVRFGSHNYEVHIFGGYYKLWRSDTSEYTGTYNAPGGSTAGFRNIGMNHTRVYIDGVNAQLIALNVNYAVPVLRFGSKAAGSEGTSLKLLESLNYIRAHYRSQATPPDNGGVGGGGFPLSSPNPSESGDPPPPWQPVVNHTSFDGARKLQVLDVVVDNSDPEEVSIETFVAVDVEDGQGRERRFFDGGEVTEIQLPSISRRLGVVIRDNSDSLVHGEEGLEVYEALEEGEGLPGVAYRALHHAQGGMTLFRRGAQDATAAPDWRGDGSNVEAAAVFEAKCMTSNWGNPVSALDRVTSQPRPVRQRSGVLPLDPGSGLKDKTEGSGLHGMGSCFCNEADPSDNKEPEETTDTSTGNEHDQLDGDQQDAAADTETGEGSKQEEWKKKRRRFLDDFEKEAEERGGFDVAGGEWLVELKHGYIAPIPIFLSAHGGFKPHHLACVRRNRDGDAEPDQLYRDQWQAYNFRAEAEVAEDRSLLERARDGYAGFAHGAVDGLTFGLAGLIVSKERFAGWVGADANSTEFKAGNVVGQIAGTATSIVLTSGAGATIAGARGAVAGGRGLVHLTNSTAAKQIASSGQLIGRSGVYATSFSTGGRTGLGLTARTGLAPSQVTAGFRIPNAAMGAFRSPVPIGPFTGWQAAFGTRYTAAGTLNLTTGAFVRTGPNLAQAGWYAADAAAVLGLSGLRYAIAN